MKKGILITGIIVTISLGTSQLLPVFASGGDTENRTKPERKVTESVDHTEEETSVQASNQPNKSDNESFRQQLRNNEQYDKLTRNVAEDLGIETKGKDLDKIEAEVRSTILEKKAKESGIETEGKSEDTLISELKDKYIKDLEKTTPNNNYEELRMKPESRKKDIINKAQQFGIETEDKEFVEIVEELKSAVLKDKTE